MAFSFTALIRFCTNTKSLLNGKSIHAHFIKSLPADDVYSMNHLLSMYARLNHIEHAQQLFDEMSERNIFTWVNLINSYAQKGSSENALGCFRAMILEGFVPNDFAFVSALSVCTEIGAVRCGKEIHARICKSGECSNSIVVNCLVNFYSKCGLFKVAKLVFDTCGEPDLINWGSKISCHCQCGENEEALRVFLRSLRAGESASEYVSASVLGACAALKVLRLGMQVHSVTLKNGVRMDQYIQAALVNVYSKCGEIELAYKAFREAGDPNLYSFTALIGGCLKAEKTTQAIFLFSELLSTGLKPTEQTYVTVLGAFDGGTTTQMGRQLHSSIIKLGYDSFTFVSNALLDFYSKTSVREELYKTYKEMDASRVREELYKTYKEMDTPDADTFNALIAGFVKSCRYEEAIKAFRNMLCLKYHPTLYTYSSALSMCGDLPAIEWGKQTHCCIVKPGFQLNVVVGSTLIDMYAKCGRLDYARKVFDRLSTKNLVSWNTMITGYAQHGLGNEALGIYNMMQRNKVKPSSITFVGVLSACGHVGVLKEGLFGSTVTQIGRQLHSSIIKWGHNSLTHVSNALLYFYSKNSLPEESYKTYKEMDAPDTVTFNALISGFVKSCRYEEAIKALRDMLFRKYHPTVYTYCSVLNMCGDLPAIEWGKQIHCCIVKPGFQLNVSVGNTLIDMYSKCGRLDYARNVFDRLSTKDIFSWNTMLTGYAQHGLGNEALGIYNMMQQNKVKPCSITFIGILSACGHVGLLQEGLYHFNSMPEYGIGPKADHIACMVSLFARKGQTKRAYDFIMSAHVKPNKIVWRSLLSGCRANKDLDVAKYAADKILASDPEDTSALVMLSNIYADLKMWNETAEIRKMMGKKPMKKDTGFSWIELHNEIYSFSAGGSPCIQGYSIVDILTGLTDQLADAGHVPDDISS